MTGTVRHSVYCFATDVLDEGASVVLDNVVQRAGVRSVAVAAKYHAASDVYPHNPVRRLATVPPGVFYRADPARHANAALQPRPSPLSGGRDVLRELCAAAVAREMEVDAWVVVLHHDEADAGGPGLQVNCFGDEMAGSLCPANPDVKRFAESIVGEIASYPLGTVRLESLHYHCLPHGHHHERVLEQYGAAALFVLGLCFCPSCLERAESEGVDGRKVAASARASLQVLFEGRTGPRPLDAEAVVALCGDEGAGYLVARTKTVTTLTARMVDVTGRAGRRLSMIDPTIPGLAFGTGRLTGDLEVAPWQYGFDAGALREAGAMVEIPGYLRDLSALESTLASVGGSGDEAGGDLATILRPGLPDSANAEQLAAKVSVAMAAGCTEVNFYNYGLYRLQALDLIGSALA
jgi:hypothetical protein